MYFQDVSEDTSAYPPPYMSCLVDEITVCNSWKKRRELQEFSKEIVSGIGFDACENRRCSVKHPYFPQKGSQLGWDNHSLFSLFLGGGAPKKEEVLLHAKNVG